MLFRIISGIAIFADAISRKEKELWAAAFNKEYVKFQERNGFEVVQPKPGIKVFGFPTRTEYTKGNSLNAKYVWS